MNFSDPDFAHEVDVREHPFLEFQGFVDGTWARFLIITVASSKMAMIFPRIGLPLITGYMIIGVLCGPYILNLVPKQDFVELAYVTQAALSFIAFSAGSELYLPELRSLFKRIIAISGALAVSTMAICTIFIYIIIQAGLVPFASELPGGCQLSIAILASSIMVARSPASAIAVVREIRAKGPITSTMLGVTVVGDVVVLVLFTLSSSIALAQCEGGGFEMGEFMITILTLIAAVGLGFLLGQVLTFLLWIPRVPARYTILPLGFLTFILCDWFAIYSTDRYGITINFDALLICITAGYVVTNKSRNRTKFLQLLGTSGPIIFIPFFTKIGVELNLKVLAQSVAFGFLVFTVRAICVFIGGYVGGTLSNMSSKEKNIIWLTMLAQAGVSLGLASEVAVKFAGWGANFQTTIIAVVLINQFAGPVACKWALNKAGEAGKMKGSNDEHEHDDHEHDNEKPSRPKVLFAGIDQHTYTLSQRLINDGFECIFMDSDMKKINQIIDKIEIPKQEETEDNEHTHTHTQKQQTDIIDEFGNAVTSTSHVINNVTIDKSAYIHTCTYNLSLISQSSVQNMFEIALNSTNIRSIKCAILSLESDEMNHELGIYLTEKLHVARVVTKIYNPTWTSIFSSQGIVPVFDMNTISQVIYQAIETSTNTFMYVEPPKKDSTLADTLASVIDTKEAKYMTLMTEEEKQSFLQSYPNADDVMSRKSMNLQLNPTKVELFAHVPAHMRDQYLEHISDVHDYSVQDNEEDKKKVDVAFLTPSQFMGHDETQKLEKQINKQKNQKHNY